METTIKVCDVYGMKKDVASYHVLIEEIGINGFRLPTDCIVEMTPDLCPRALKRAKRLIEKACCPPTPRVKK